MATAIPIVEGHGEYEGVRTLIQRVWIEHVGGTHIEVLRPIRISKDKISRESEITRAVDLAGRKIRDEEDPLILIMRDSDDDCPVDIASKISVWCDGTASDIAKEVVLPVRTIESWLIAGRSGFLDRLLPNTPVELAETDGLGKGWMKRYFDGSYSETIDFPGLCSLFSIADALKYSRSFRKFCKALNNHNDNIETVS